MVLEFIKLEFLEVLPPWHKLSWHLGLKNATWYSSPRNSSTVLFVTFTSHSRLPEHTLTLLHTQTYKPQTLTPSAAEDSRRWPLTQLSHWGQLFSFRVTSFIWNFNGFKIRNIEKKTQSWCCVSINRSAKK